VLRASLHAIGALCVCLLSTSLAQARDIDLDIRDTDLTSAVIQLAEAAGLQVFYVADLLAGYKAPRLVGRYDPLQALETLLRGTGLDYDIRNGQTLVIRRASGNRRTVTDDDTARARARRAHSLGRDRSSLSVEPLPMENVIVEARKRATALLRTPDSITALTGESMQWRHPNDLMDVYRQVPGLFVMDRGPYLRKLFVRGIQNDVDTGGGTVGVYIDDMPLSMTGRTDVQLVDVDRIEVLRGPQGTLYGASSMTGAVKYLFNRARPGVSEGLVNARVSATGHGGWNSALDGTINLPLDADRAALRLVGYRTEDSGFIRSRFDGLTLPAYQGLPPDSFYPGSPAVRGHGEIEIPSLRRTRTNAHRVSGARAAFTFEPDEQISVHATVMGESGRALDGQRHQPEVGELQQQLSVRLPIEDDFIATDLVLDRRTESHDLHASAYILRRWARMTEPFADQFPGELTPSGTELVSREQQKLFTTEVRLSSDSTQRLSWLGGVFFLNYSTAAKQWVWLQHDHGNQTIDNDTPFEERQYAGFGELSWRLSDTLTATAGARIFKVEQSTGPITYNIEPAIFFLAPRGPDGVIHHFADVVDTYRFNLAWDSGAGTLLYAQAAQGFRVGGVNTNLTRNPQVPATYGSDDLWSYELGVKRALFDGRLTLDAAAYFLDWSDVQTRVFVNGAGFNINAGRAHVAGVELSLVAQPWPDFILEGAFSVLQAKLDDPEPSGNFPTGSEGRAGDRLPGVPRGAASLTARYSHSIDSRSEWTLTGSGTYTGESLAEFRGPRADRLRGYSIVDITAGYSVGAWTAELFVHNALDKRADLNISHFLNQPRTITPNRPRTVGLSLSRSF
jgi:iron complex outermembrane recepter protein